MTIRSVSAFGALLLLGAFLLVLGSGGDASRTSPAAAKEFAEELREITEPSSAMLARQFSGEGAVMPSEVFAKARRRSLTLARATRKAAPRVAGADWALAGPTNLGGRVLDIAVDPEVPNQIFAATASGGVWKSSDAGGTFTPAWPADLTQSIGSVAMTKSGVLFAGTGETGPGGGSMTYGGTGVYRSEDRGETWTHVGLEGTSRISRVVVDPGDDRKIWVAASGNLFREGGERGLYVSEDGGDSWKLALAGLNGTTGATDVAIDPKNPRVLLAAMWDHQRGENTHRYFGLGSGLFRSADGGRTWTRTGGPTLGSTPVLGRIGVAFSAKNPNYAYAIAQKASGRWLGLYKSTDGGVTWGPPQVDANIIQAAASFGWWFGRVWVHPENENDVFVAGVNLIRSKNGGQSTSTVASSVLHADHHALAFDPKVPGRVYNGNDGGVYRSDDDGRAWTFATYQPWSQLYSLDVSEQDPRFLVAGLQDNGVNKNWQGADELDEKGEWRSYGGGDGERTLINPDNPLEVYGCSQYGNCFVNRNGASGGNESFTSKVVSARKNWFTPIEFDPEDSRTLYTGGEIMSRSTDGARSWTPISRDLSNGPQPDEGPDADYRSYGSLTTIGPAGKSTGYIYAGTDDGNLWYSSDNGSSWTKATDSDLPKAWITRVQADPADPRTAYATYSGFRSGKPGYLFRTTDGGVNWTNITGDLPAAPLNDVNVIGGTLVVASDFGVYASRDGGGRWLRVGRNLPLVPVHELRYHAGTGRLFVATFGRSIWSIDFPSAADFGARRR